MALVASLALAASACGSERLPSGDRPARTSDVIVTSAARDASVSAAPLRTVADRRIVADPSVVDVPRPTRIRVPSVSIDSDVVDLGLTADGAMEVPSGDERDLAGWFVGGPRPGAVGPAVVVGHVAQDGAPSVFHRLPDLDRGARVLVDRADGSTAVFEVTRTEQHAKAAFPSTEVYGDVAGPALRLITCGGTVDRSSGRFDDNVIAFARLVQVVGAR